MIIEQLSSFDTFTLRSSAEKSELKLRQCFFTVEETHMRWVFTGFFLSWEALHLILLSRRNIWDINTISSVILLCYGANRVRSFPQMWLPLTCGDLQNRLELWFDQRLWLCVKLKTEMLKPQTVPHFSFHFHISAPLFKPDTHNRKTTRLRKGHCSSLFVLSGLEVIIKEEPWHQTPETLCKYNTVSRAGSADITDGENIRETFSHIAFAHL